MILCVYVYVVWISSWIKFYFKNFHIEISKVVSSDKKISEFCM